MSPRPRTGKEGFSLLEVMVAIAILGLALSVILSAQGGLAASNKAAANMGNAVNVGRCKVTEIEEKLLKLGYPEVDDLQTDLPCCSDERSVSLSDTFRCDTRVEKIVLPAVPGADGGADSFGADGGIGSITSALAGAAGSGSAAAPGGLPNIPGMINNPAGGASLDLDAGLQNIGTSLQSQMGGQGAAGLLNMVLGMVYPSLKPMMEASIRKVTVSVKWKEGPNDRSLDLVEYVTNPQQGGFVAGALPGQDPNAPGGASTAAPGALPGAPTTPAAGATGASTIPAAGGLFK